MRRTRRRNGGRRVSTVVVVGVVVSLLLVSFGTGLSSFATGSVGRGSSVSVTRDANALVGLNVSQNVSTGQTSRLVTPTDRLDQSLTVTVRLVNGSDSNASLSYRGVNEGSSVSVDLPSGNSTRINTTVNCTSSLVGKKLYMSVNATGHGLRMEANRSTTVVAGC